MRNLSPNVSMVVAERGSDWSGWAEAMRPSCSEVVVVHQLKGESPSTFAQRVRTRVAEVELSGQTLAEAVIVSGGRTDGEVMTARSLAIRALVAPMVHAGAGRVYLGSLDQDRYSMLALASIVAENLRGTGVSVAPTSGSPALAA